MSMGLIKDLNAEHRALMKALDMIRAEQGLTEKAQLLVDKTRNALLAHLDREEKEFYPVMRKAAETNNQLKDTLKVMGEEMDQIATKAMAAFNNWTAGKGQGRFVTDFNNLYELLEARIKREEHALYAKYLRLQ